MTQTPVISSISTSRGFCPTDVEQIFFITRLPARIPSLVSGAFDRKRSNTASSSNSGSVIRPSKRQPSSEGDFRRAKVRRVDGADSVRRSPTSVLHQPPGDFESWDASVIYRSSEEGASAFEHTSSGQARLTPATSGGLHLSCSMFNDTGPDAETAYSETKTSIKSILSGMEISGLETDEAIKYGIRRNFLADPTLAAKVRNKTRVVYCDSEDEAQLKRVLVPISYEGQWSEIRPPDTEDA